GEAGGKASRGVSGCAGGEKAATARALSNKLRLLTEKYLPEYLCRLARILETEMLDPFKARHNRAATISKILIAYGVADFIANGQTWDAFVHDHRDQTAVRGKLIDQSSGNLLDNAVYDNH